MKKDFYEVMLDEALEDIDENNIKELPMENGKVNLSKLL